MDIINSKTYGINGLQFEWGMPYDQVKAMLQQFSQFKSYTGWKYIRCECESIFGLKATEAEVSSPFFDKPILRVGYQVSPRPKSFFERHHSPYLKPLKKILGTPESTYYNYHSGISKEYSSGVVVFNAKWIIDGIYIGLSVYGDVRNNDSGPAGALVYAHWMNEMKAAEPFIGENEKFENMIEEYIHERTSEKKFTLGEIQRPYYITHYEMPDPDIALKDSAVRSAQMALYTKHLYQTPKGISAILNSDEVLFYIIPGLDKSFISNKWDTICLDDIPTDKITYYDILPARGNGGRELEINYLKIKDIRASETLGNLIIQIESRKANLIKRIETFDD